MRVAKLRDTLNVDPFEVVSTLVSISYKEFYVLTSSVAIICGKSYGQESAHWDNVRM